jgi:hypothetical protein
MPTVFSTFQPAAITANGTTTVDVITGKTYLVGAGGTFASASLQVAFIDGRGNVIPANATPFTAAGIQEVKALTATMRITTASATGSTDVDVTVTRAIEEE